MEKQKQAGYEPIFPKTLDDQRSAVDKTQKQLRGTVHGRKDWLSPELYHDFRTRHKDYMAAHPNFDPNNPDDVRDFQTSHTGLAIDGDFGEHTYSTPGYKKSEKQIPLPAADINQPAGNKKTYQAPEINQQEASTNNPFWTQDMVNMAGTYGDSQRIKKYMPWQAGYNTQLPEGIYYDPTRELAANSEQANIADQTLSTYSGAQNTSSRISDVQGKSLENAANILGKYNNMNVALANQLESSRKGIMNEDSANRANQATGLYDKTIAVNQNFDNAKAMARQNFRQSFIDSWTNRGKTQALNSMNKQYRVDPKTGFVDFTGKPGELTGAQKQAQWESTFNGLMSNAHMKDNPELASKNAWKLMGMGSDDEANIQYEDYKGAALKVGKKIKKKRIVLSKNYRNDQV